MIDVLYEALIFLVNYLFYPGEEGVFSIRRILSLFIAFSVSGAIVVFMSQGAILKYFGAETKKTTAYLVASVSGTILAVCSCSVLPMFASIRKKGAGLGPAMAFLFSGPAINILAITMTLELIGIDIGIFRIIGAIVLALVIGITMHVLFHKQESQNTSETFQVIPEDNERKPWQTGLFLATLVAILISGVRNPIFTILFLVFLLIQWVLYFTKDDLYEWRYATFDLIKKIVPLFLVGVFLAGILHSLLTEEFLASLVGTNAFSSNIYASLFGATMYFATLSEVPIVNSLIDLGMHKGPALALLLAGPSVSIPNMVIIGKVIGVKRTLAYISLVILLSASVGLIAGFIIG